MVLEGQNLKDIPTLVKGYVKEGFGVLCNKNSFVIYLQRNYPSIFHNIVTQRITSRRKFRWCGVDFYTVNGSLSCSLYSIINDGQYSIPECHVKKGNIVLDCGAHIGIFSYSAILRGAETVYSFEPWKEAYSVLAKNIELWNCSERIIPVNMAVSSDNSKKTFYTYKNPDGNSLYLWNDKGRGHLIASPKVDCITIDAFVKEYDIKRVDFIKIDTEGSELNILKGARRTIKEFKPRLTISVYHRPEDKENIPNYIYSVREDYNYKIVKIGDECGYWW